MCITESLCCTPETNKILSTNYTSTTTTKSLELHPNNEKNGPTMLH